MSKLDELIENNQKLTDPPENQNGEKLSPLDQLLMSGIQQGTIRNITPSMGGTQFSPLSQYDQGLVEGVDQQRLRAFNQPWYDELGNATGRVVLNTVPQIVEFGASILDFGDYVNRDQEVGNAVTRYSQELQRTVSEDILPIYQERDTPLNITDSAWWFDNGSNLVTSAAAFVGTGAGVGSLVGRGLQSLKWLGSLSRGLSTATTAVALNQAEAMSSATNIYDKVLKDALEKGLSDVDAMQKAADAAAYSININRANVLLNLSSVGSIVNGFKSIGKSTLPKIGIEGVQEYAEETVNLFAEREGERQAEASLEGQEYEFNFNRMVSDALTAEGVEAGILGFLGGAVQTGATMKLRKKLDLPTQNQTRVDYLEDLDQTVGQDETFLADIFQKGETFAKYQTLKDQVVEEGKTPTPEQEERIGDIEAKQFADLAYDSFETGTKDQVTQSLEQRRDTDSKEASNEQENQASKEKATRYLSELDALEGIYKESQEYVNSREAYLNRALRRRLNQKRDVLSARQAENVTNLTQDVQSLNIPEELTAAGYIFNPEVVDQPYDSEDAQVNEAANELHDQVRQLPSYREYAKVKEQQDALNDRVAETNDAYTNLTSQETQSALEQQLQDDLARDELENTIVDEMPTNPSNEDLIETKDRIKSEVGQDRPTVDVINEKLKQNRGEQVPFQQETEVQEPSVIRRRDKGITTIIRESEGRYIDGDYELERDEEGKPILSSYEVRDDENQPTGETDSVLDVFESTNGILDVNSPNVSIGDEVVVVREEDWKYFKSTSPEDVVYNVYATDKQGNAVGKPLTHLSSSFRDEKAKELRDKGYAIFRTIITNKTSGDVVNLVDNQGNPQKNNLKTLELDWVKKGDFWEEGTLPFSPILAVGRSRGRVNIPNLEQVENAGNEPEYVESALAERDKELNYRSGVPYVGRMSANGRMIFLELQQRPLAEQETDYVIDNLFTNNIDPIVYVNRSRNPQVSIARTSGNPRLIAHKGTIYFPYENMWIGIKDGFFDTRSPQYTTFRKNGKRVSTVNATGETVAKVRNELRAFLKTQNRNVEAHLLNTEDAYVDPVDNQSYANYFDFLATSETLTTDLPSGAVFRNASIELKPEVETIENADVIPTASDEVSEVGTEVEFIFYDGVRRTGSVESRDGDNLLVRGKNGNVYNIKTNDIVSADRYYQVTTPGGISYKMDRSLENAVKSFLNNIGVEIKVVDDLKDRFGININGVADLTNKVIEVTKDGYWSALPEEAAHFFIEGMEGNPVIQELITRADSLDFYPQILEQYSEAYEGDEVRLRKEAAAQAISNYLIAEHSAPKNWIQSIVRRLKRLFKKAFGRQELFEIAGDMLFDSKIDGYVPKGHGPMFSISNDPVDVVKNIKSKIKGTLRDQLYRYRVTGAPRERINELLGEIDKVRSDEAVVAFVEGALDELKKIQGRFYNLMVDQDEDKKIQARDIRDLRRRLNVLNVLPEIRIYVNNIYASSKILKDSNINKMLRDLSARRSEIEADLAEESVKVVAKDVHQTTSQDIDYAEVERRTRMADNDVGFVGRWLDSMINSPDVVLRSMAKKTMDAFDSAKLLSRSFLQKKDGWLDANYKYDEWARKKGYNVNNVNEKYDPIIEKDINQEYQFVSEKNAEVINDELRILKEITDARAKGEDIQEDDIWEGHYSKYYDTNQAGVRGLKPRYVSKKYTAIQKDPELKELYDIFIGEYLKHQEKIPYYLRPGYRIPSMRKSVLDRIGAANFEDKFRVLQDAVIENVAITHDEMDRAVRDEQGNKVDAVPVRFISKHIKKPDVSLDVGSTVFAFIEEANRNEAYNEIVDEVELARDVLAERRVRGKRGVKAGRESNSYQQINDFLRRMLYGEVKREEGGFEVLGVKFDVAKLTDLLNKYTSVRALGLDIPVAISNVATGEATLLQEASAGKWFNLNDYTYGKKKFWQEVIPFAGEIGKRKKTSKLHLIMDLFDVRENERYGNLGIGESTNRARGIFSQGAGKALRLPFDMGEIEMRGSAMLSYFNTIKLKDAQGKEINLYDAYEVVDGKEQLRKGVTYQGREFNQEDFLLIKQRMRQINRTSHGIYSQFDSPAAKALAFGRLIMLFRGWLVPGIQRRYRGKYYDESFAEWNEGNYISAFNFFKEMYGKDGVMPTVLKGLKYVTFNGLSETGYVTDKEKEELSPQEQKQLKDLRVANFKKTLTELYMIGALTVLANFAFEEDDESLLRYQVLRLNRELGSLAVPYSARNLLDVIDRPVASLPALEGLIRLSANGTIGLVTGEAYETVESGTYKGMPKVTVDAIKATPVLRQAWKLNDLDTQINWLSRDRY